MIRFGLRNAHEYGRETYEAKRLRLRDRAEDPRAGIDTELPTDRRDDYTPAADLHAHIPLLSACQTAPAPCGGSTPIPDTGPRNSLQRAARPGTGEAM